MSYRLDLAEPVPDALRTVALERLGRAGRRLREDHQDDTADAVHGARKDLKKTRALLRLARPGLPRDVFKRENRALRDLGREMSSGRDAEVMVETCESLSARSGGQDSRRQLAALQRRLAAHARRSQGDFDPDKLAQALVASRDRALDWPLGDCDAGELQAGLKRTYRAGRQALAAVERKPSDERWHEWRKRVKDLWYHHRLLADAWRGPMKAHAKECDKLGGLLGDDHDLATLAATLTASGGVPVPPSVDLDAVLQLIATRRAELQAEALALGRRVYAEKPKAHARRLGGYLAARRPLPA